MKKLLTLLTILTLYLTGFTQTSLSWTQIPTTDPDLNRPGGGAEQWTAGQNIVNIPVEGTNTQRLDAYYRFQWIDIQPSNSAGPGQCDFKNFDQQLNDAINKRQKFGFGIMPNCCSGPSVGGAGLVYPLALHNAMQAETPKDWNNGGGWYENPNSPSWLTWFTALHQAINAHIQSGSFMGVRYRDVVNRVDVRVLGDFGEQAVLNGGPVPTDASVIALVNAVVQSYPDIKCVAMIGAFSANTGVGITGPTAAVGKHELTTSNNAGLLGWRWDSWGWQDGYIHSWLENNPNVVSGFHFDTAIMNRYRYAPVCGEPADLGAAGNFGDLPVRVLQYKAQSFGNGNLDQNNPPNATIRNNFRAASKIAGYRLTLVSAGSTLTTAPQTGGTYNPIINWSNVNGIPTYETWRIIYEWRDAGVVLQRDTAAFLLKGFYTTFTDNETFTMRTVPAGVHDLYLKVVDPTGYRAPMPLFITGRTADGAYPVKTGITVTSSGSAANAGPNQNISIATVNLTGSGSVGASTFAWTLISGPNTPSITTPGAANTTVTGLITGTYVFQLAINGGSVAPLISQVTIIVNAPPVQANAGNNQTITLPTAATTLNGSGSTGASTYLWTFTSGPNTPGITTPGTVSTTVTGLIQGTYVFDLSINGGASHSSVTVTVLPAAAAVANAGPSRTYTITPPATTVTGALDGTLSSGNITSYAWTKQSGPAGESILSPGTVTSSVTGLTAGVYVFQLQVNGGSTDTMRIYINPAAPPVPAATNIFGNQAPSGSVENDGSALELGVKFRSSVSGYITGIRFYKSVGNTGTHIGQLYNSAGGLLASATFSSETNSGWQTVQIIPAIPIAPNTTYIAAYWSSAGYYTSSPNYFINAVVNTPLTALADGTDGHNGVFKYTGSPAFPNVYTVLNDRPTYWVDVVFSLTNPNTAAGHKFQSIYFKENLNLR